MSSRSFIFERLLTVVLLIVAGGVGVWALRPTPAMAVPKIVQPKIVIAINGEVTHPGVYELPFGARAFSAIQAAGGFTRRADADLVNPAKRLEDGDQLRVPALEFVPTVRTLDDTKPLPLIKKAQKLDVKPKVTALKSVRASSVLLFALPKPVLATVVAPVVNSVVPSTKPQVTSRQTRVRSVPSGIPKTATSSDLSVPNAPDPLVILARGVNVNTASELEIEALPGIGPALAARIIQARPYANLEDLDRVKGIGPKMLEKIGSYLRF